MPIEDELRKAAREIAEQAKARVTHLEREIIDLEKRLAEAKAKCDSARLAPQRLANYQVKLGADYQCPRCWIDSETLSLLRPVRGHGAQDFLECDRCNSDYAI